MDDVNRLAQDPSGATRARTAQKLAEQFNTAAFAPAELKLAEEIFRVMARDAEVRVRQALAITLKTNPQIPHDLAITLARDVDAVAIPILSFSQALAPEDLIEIIAAQTSFTKMEAIAARPSVDPRVCTALIDRGSEQVVTRLLANDGADVPEAALHKAVDRFGESEPVQSSLVHRAVLPVTVAERLVSRVADHLRTRLLAKHQLSPELAQDLILHSRERATVGVAMGVGDEGLAGLVRQMRANGTLTASLVLRAICMGNLRFFEHALAALAGIPVTNARTLVHEASGAGLRALWAKAHLPEGSLPAVRAAVEIVQQTEFSAAGSSPETYARRILERVLTQHDSLGEDFRGDDLEFLLARVSQMPPAFAPAVH
jgi:uncharacterized protein (DUF2336 family)